MINLLAPEMKQQIRAARTNVILRNYCLIFSAAIFLVLGIFGAGTWLAMEERKEANSRKAQAEQASATYSQTKQAAESFANDLKQAKTILTSEVSFYKLITSLAAVVPPGVILNNLSLETGALQKPLTISGQAVNYEAAVQLKNALSKSDIFTDVKLTTVTETVSSDPLSTRYPISVTVSATFNPNFKAEGS